MLDRNIWRRDMSNLIKIDNEYKDWITEVSKRFRQTQLKAAVKTNSDMLRFYWSLGRDIVGLSEKNDYGSGFYKTISEDLKDIFPNIKSFSPTNLKYMRYFYEMYPEFQVVNWLLTILKMQRIVNKLLTIWGRV